MMENKCNKTPNKYLDHVYCQSGENKNYMRPNNNPGGGSTSSDLLALLKENKQLKAMLILHLDLIQEQSDQLTGKDKQLSNLKEELQTTRAKNLQLEAQVQELQLQIQRQIKRAAAPTCELALLSPPPLAKIQCKKDGNNASPTNIIGECNGKLISKIILQRVSIGDGSFVESTHSPNSTTTISDTASEATIQKDIDEHDEEEEIEELTTEESNDESTLALPKEQETETQHSLTLTIPRGAKPKPGNVVKIPTPTSTPVQVCVTPPTPSRGKQMPLMLWHAPNLQSEDESGSCESAPDVEKQPTTPMISPTSHPKSPIIETPKTKKRSAAQITVQTTRQTQKNQNQQQQQQNQKQQTHKKRCTYITTSQMYATREWEDEDGTVCDYEFSQAEAEALFAEAPMLEIPKWTEHDLSPLYCIEGTEDLSDNLFLKRHSKLEVDEKRRKKWDVQQIREQRRVEKLKRRHYKNEIQPSEQQTLKSFYPQLENLQSICYVSELPVQAFGEMIPKINSNTDFRLPWLQQIEPLASPTTPSATTSQTSITTSTRTTTATPTTTTTASSSSVEIMVNNATSSTSTQAQQQLLKSTFVFLKKRKRQQSSSAGAANTSGTVVGAIGSGGGGTARQRTLAATKAAAIVSTPTVTLTTVTTPVCTTTVAATTTTTTTTEDATNSVEDNKSSNS